MPERLLISTGAASNWRGRPSARTSSNVRVAQEGVQVRGKRERERETVGNTYRGESATTLGELGGPAQEEKGPENKMIVLGRAEPGLMLPCSFRSRQQPVGDVARGYALNRIKTGARNVERRPYYAITRH